MSTATELRSALGARTISIEPRDLLGPRRPARQWATTEDDDSSRSSVCVGGDGTQSTTALAAIRRSVPFLPVSSRLREPASHARSATRDSVEGVLDLLAHGQVVQCDVGMCNDEMFLCQQSYGLIAEVQDAVEAAAATPRARWQRWLAYYRAALRHLREEPPRRLRVVVDGRVVAVDAALVIVANVKTYGAWLPSRRKPRPSTASSTSSS